MALIETWFVKNIYVSNIDLIDIMVPYTLIPGADAVDLLNLNLGGPNNTAESIASSHILRNAQEHGWVESDYAHLHDDYSETSHTHPGLTTLTDGSDADADALHTHDGLTSVLEVNTLINTAIDGMDLSDYVTKAGNINQLSDIFSEGAVIEDAVSKAHDVAHTLLEHTDTAIVTTAKLTLLMDGSNADCCHTHSFQVHNNLTGLDGGEAGAYYHLTLSQHDTLTDGSNADGLHTHSGTDGVGIHNDLELLQGGDISNDEMFHLTLFQTDIVSRFDVDSSGLTFDGEAIGGSGGTSIHNDLAGIQGGATDEYYHLDYNEFNLLINNNVADTLHTHDHNLLRGIQGGNASNDDVYHLTSDQVDDVDVIPLLLPAEPTDFPASALSITSVGSNPYLCDNSVPDNTSGGGSLPSVGTLVDRVVDITPASDIIQNSGPGNTGTITAVINNVADGSRVMTTADDTGTYTSLVISNNEDFPPSTPGFWMDFDVQIDSNSVLSAGHNRYKITHTGASNTADLYFILDDLNTTPTVAAAGPVTVTESSSSKAWSSGIEHYTNGTVLNLNNATMTNVSGETYYNGNPIGIDDTGENIMNGEETKSYAAVGITTPVSRQLTSAQTLTSPITFTLDGGTIHNESNIRYRGRNVAGTGSFVEVTATNILYMNGTQNQHNASFIDEDNVYVDDSELGSSPNGDNAQRIKTLTGDTPAETFIGTSTDWDPDDIPGLVAHDAAVVGGVCSRNQTNYSSGYLPVGANLSGQDSTQYISFWFRRTPVSQFDIQITGTIAGCWVELAGESETYATSNGWWDMTLVYQGTGIPGTQGGANGNNGCAVGTAIPTGSSISNQRYTCTFGQGVSSSTATNNNIIVRFKLITGQSITALSFRGVS